MWYSPKERRALAKKAGIKNYRFLAGQNKKLIDFVNKSPELNTNTPTNTNPQNWPSQQDINNATDVVWKAFDKLATPTDKKPTQKQEKAFNNFIVTHWLKATDVSKEQAKEFVKTGGIKKYNSLIPGENTNTTHDKNFKSNVNSLKEAQGIVNPYFDQQSNRLSTDYSQSLSSFNRLIQYTDTAIANKLQQTNTTFAKSMTKATNIYGARNLINSWIQKSWANTGTEWLQQSINNANYYANRSKISLESRKQNLATVYNRNQQDLGQNRQFYTDLTSKQLSDAKWMNQLGDYLAGRRKIIWGDPTVNAINQFNTTTNTTPKNKTMTGQQANKKSLTSKY